MRHAARPLLAAGARSSAAGARRQLHDVRHAAPQAAAAAAQTVTLKLRIGANILPIEAEVGKTLLDAAHRNEVNVDGTCDGDLACSTCHVRIEDQEIYAKADAISKGSETRQKNRKERTNQSIQNFAGLCLRRRGVPACAPLPYRRRPGALWPGRGEV